MSQQLAAPASSDSETSFEIVEAPSSDNSSFEMVEQPLSSTGSKDSDALEPSGPSESSETLKRQLSEDPSSELKRAKLDPQDLEMNVETPRPRRSEMKRTVVTVYSPQPYRRPPMIPTVVLKWWDENDPIVPFVEAQDDRKAVQSSKDSEDYQESSEFSESSPESPESSESSEDIEYYPRRRRPMVPTVVRRLSDYDETEKVVASDGTVYTCGTRPPMIPTVVTKWY